MKITNKCLNRDYRGCGKAWAAIKNGKVVALRYMGEREPGAVDTTDRYYPGGSQPLWIAAIRKNADGLDAHMLPTTHSGFGLGRIAEAARLCADCPCLPRQAEYRAKELLTMARNAISHANHDEFAAYRNRSRVALAELGQVVSGMCSCTEFYPKHREEVAA